MNKKNRPFLSIGIPSMCMIFSVLCLVILALLTLGTSRQDLRTSQLALDQTTAYYTACSAVSKECEELIDCAKNAYRASDGQEDYNARMKSAAEKYADASWNPDTQVLSFSVVFTDEQAIYIEITASGPTPKISTWKTISTTDWNPDTRQPVYKGDTK